MSEKSLALPRRVKFTSQARLFVDPPWMSEAQRDLTVT